VNGPAPALARTPLAALLPRIVEGVDWFDLRLGAAPPGWEDGRRLHCADALGEWIGRAQGAYRSDATVAGALLASQACGGLALALGAPYLVAGVVPRLRVDDLGLRVSEDGGLVGLSLGHPRADGGPAGAGLVAGRYAELAGPLLDLVAARTRRGPRALWADAAYRLASVLAVVAAALGEPEAGRDAARAVLAAAPPPLREPLDWVPSPGQHEVLVPTHPVCCLAYRAAPWEGRFCAHCPAEPPGR